MYKAHAFIPPRACAVMISVRVQNRLFCMLNSNVKENKKVYIYSNMIRVSQFRYRTESKITCNKLSGKQTRQKIQTVPQIELTYEHIFFLLLSNLANLIYGEEKKLFVVLESFQNSVNCRRFQSQKKKKTKILVVDKQ